MKMCPWFIRIDDVPAAPFAENAAAGSDAGGRNGMGDVRRAETGKPVPLFGG